VFFEVLVICGLEEWVCWGRGFLRGRLELLLWCVVWETWCVGVVALVDGVGWRIR
jgi:hypothetical protein